MEFRWQDDEPRLTMTQELYEYLKLNKQDIEDEIEKGELDHPLADRYEDQVTEHARRLLNELCKIVSYTAINNPGRLERIFDGIPAPSEEFPNAPPEKLTGELALKIIVMMTGTYLQGGHREHLKQALEVGYNCNQSHVDTNEGLRLLPSVVPDEKVYSECKTHLDWYMGFYGWWER